MRVKWRGLLRKATLAVEESARISACTCPTTLGNNFKHLPMQALSTFLQIPKGSDCPLESLFKIDLNSKYKKVIFGNEGQPLCCCIVCTFNTVCTAVNKVVKKSINANPRLKINQRVYFITPKCCSALIFG